MLPMIRKYIKMTIPPPRIIYAIKGLRMSAREKQTGFIKYAR